jgi:hypothetical protein
LAGSWRDNRFPAFMEIAWWEVVKASLGIFVLAFIASYCLRSIVEGAGGWVVVRLWERSERCRCPMRLLADFFLFIYHDYFSRGGYGPPSRREYSSSTHRLD